MQHNVATWAQSPTTCSTSVCVCPLSLCGNTVPGDGHLARRHDLLLFAHSADVWLHPGVPRHSSLLGLVRPQVPVLDGADAAAHRAYWLSPMAWGMQTLAINELTSSNVRCAIFSCIPFSSSSSSFSSSSSSLSVPSLMSPLQWGALAGPIGAVTVGEEALRMRGFRKDFVWCVIIRYQWCAGR